jgi:hypothetical protein
MSEKKAAEAAKAAKRTASGAAQTAQDAAQGTAQSAQNVAAGTAQKAQAAAGSASQVRPPCLCSDRDCTSAFFKLATGRPCSTGLTLWLQALLHCQ